MKILIAGAAGFIGFHFSKKILDHSYQIIGIDNLNDYCDPSLKQSRASSKELPRNGTGYAQNYV